MFSAVLVANRGEIAVRIFRTLAELGITSIAVYSDADVGARHAAAADIAMRIGPPAPAQSYLDMDAVLEAARRSGAEAIHPGYGFLSERAAFAQAVSDAGLTWIGPPPAAIAAMGDKIAAKRTVAAAGVPVVPGRDEAGLDDEQLAAAAMEVGLPVLLKPSAGGGGKGMHLVSSEADLAGRIASARREARAAFGDDTILVERCVARPRHIEVQILADAHGGIVALGERECSLQRRHQKIVEEAPSPLLDDATRARLGASAIDAARACGYVGAGTVELIVSADRPDEYFFMEMNTRLQVEHPVTEAVWGLDLVAWQLRIAAGDRLPWGPAGAGGHQQGPTGSGGHQQSPGDPVPSGHAIEVRIYAEDPSAGFLPASGRVISYHEPAGDGIRVDSSIVEGSVVGTDYDPMLAKVVAWGADRDQARRRLRRALGETVVAGVTTNTGFLRRLVDHPDVIAGRLDTGLVERVLPDLLSDVGVLDAAIVAGLVWSLDREPAGEVVDPWDIPGGWRVGGAVPTRLDLSIDGRQVAVTVAGRASAATLVIDGGTPRLARARRVGPQQILVTVDGSTRRWWVAGTMANRYLTSEGRTWPVRQHLLDVAAGASAGASGPVPSPMPGTVTCVSVSAGDTVAAGTALVVVEAMKMEHTVVAPIDGTVAELRVRPGQAVALGETLAVVLSETS